MELILIEIDSPEWEFMWEWLKNHPINEGIESPMVALNENEAWQYMGSFKQKERVIHQFRHRCHPATNERVNLSVSGSKEFTNEQIKKSFKL